MILDFLLIVLLLSGKGVIAGLHVSSRTGQDVKFIDAENRCYWYIGGANLPVGQKSCEADGGNVFSVQSVEDALSIKDGLNIRNTTEVFIGAIFNDINGSQYYDWLSAPGTHSELLGNLSALGIGNHSNACLSVNEEFKAVDCYKELDFTICMRDITTNWPCGGSPPTTPSSTSLQTQDTSSSAPSVNVQTTQTLSHVDVQSTDSVTTKTALSVKANSMDTKTTTQGLHNTSPKGFKDIQTTSLKDGPNTIKTTTSFGSSQRLPSDNKTAVTPAVKTAFQSNYRTTTRQEADTKLPKQGHNQQAQAVNTTAKLNLSETIDNVPGKNRSLTVGELFTDILSKLKIGNTSTNKDEPNETISQTTRYCNDQADFADVNEHLSDILLIEGINGTKFTNFSNILTHVVRNANRSGNSCVPGKNQVSGLNKGNSGYQHKGNISDKFPVTEVKFLVSGIDPIPPWPGDPNLIPDLQSKNHGIMNIMRNTSRDLDELQQTKEVTNRTFEKFAGTIENVVTNTDVSQASGKLKETLLVDIMMTAERLVEQLKSPCQRLHIKSDMIDVDSKIVNVDSNLNDTSVAVKRNKKHSIRLSTAIFDAQYDTRVSTIEYKKLDAIMTSSDVRVSSHVMSVSIQRVIKNTTKKIAINATSNAIILILETFIVPEKKEGSRLCTFWDFDARNWSSSGCRLLESNSSHTTCSCDHLTNFAVLVMYLDNGEISLQSQQVLLVLTTVGCSLSIACLAMTLIAFVYLRMLGNEKILIHFNLSLALVMAQIVFVSSSDANTNPVACKVVAILLHFFFMASFTWMLVEGVALYLLCTKGFMNHRDMRIKYFFLGWGVPAVIVVISLAAKFPNYGHGPQYSCWLSVQDGLIWAFLGPMLAIVVLNVFVMGLVVRKFLTLKAVAQKTEAAKLRGSLRAMMTLLPLLGLTWLLSLLVPFSVVFHYFFVIINTLQGMCIFFLHCICNDELRKKFQAKRRRWSSPTRTGSDSDTRYTGRGKTGSFDEVGGVATTSDYVARKYAWVELGERKASY